MSDPIDRLTPCRRPPRIALMHQQWRELAFLHWELPVEALRAVVPRSLSIDTFEGKAYLGLVPFTIRGIRPPGLPPLPWLSGFHEVNVRTYVHLRGQDPGVFFFSLDAARLLAVWGARWSYRLPYFHARMGFQIAGPEHTFHSVRRKNPGAGCELRWSVHPGTPRTASPGSLEHFLLERYLLYAEKNGRLSRAQVHHPPYPIQDATVAPVQEGLIAAAGLVRPERPPDRIHASGGVDVEVFAPEFLPTSGG